MFWTPKEAASAWHCTASTARRLMKKHPEAREAGAPRPKVQMGNPFFATSDYQKQLAARRWEGHVSKASARLIVRGLIEIEVERAAIKAREMLDDSVNPDEENEWEPYEEDDDQGEPAEPFYTEQSLRDKMARKAARQPRQEQTE